MKSSNILSTSDNSVLGNILTADRQRISYIHFREGNPRLVVIAHGFYNSKESVVLQQLAECLLEEYDVFMFDFRGHGKSSGFFTWASKEDQDLKAVAQHLKGQYEKIGLIAFSLGASVAINVLSKDKIADSFVCVSAAAHISKIDYHFWQLDWKGDVGYTLFSREGRKGKGVRPGAFWLKKEDPVNNIAKLKIPILFLHGEKDWVIKPWHSKMLYEKTSSPKRIVLFKNGPHAEYLMRDNREQFLREIRRWFNESLNQNRALAT